MEKFSRNFERILRKRCKIFMKSLEKFYINIVEFLEKFRRDYIEEILWKFWRSFMLILLNFQGKLTKILDKFWRDFIEIVKKFNGNLEEIFRKFCDEIL